MFPFEGAKITSLDLASRLCLGKSPFTFCQLLKAFTINQPICTLSTIVGPVPLGNVASPVGLAPVLLGSIKYYQDLFQRVTGGEVAILLGGSKFYQELFQSVTGGKRLFCYVVMSSTRGCSKA
jgi:hypothetical protein